MLAFPPAFEFFQAHRYNFATRPFFSVRATLWRSSPARPAPGLTALNGMTEESA